MTALVAASLVLATLSYRFVEIAGRRWLRGRLGLRPPASMEFAVSRAADLLGKQGEP